VRAKIVAKAMRFTGSSYNTVVSHLNATLEGEYVIQHYDGLSSIRIVRRNTVPPHVDYEIISEELPF